MTKLIQPGNRTDYQNRLVERTEKRILLGARQSGKTETCVQTAVDRFKRNQTVVVIGPTNAMTHEIADRTKQHFEDQHTEKLAIEQRTGTGEIQFVPANTLYGQRVHRQPIEQIKRQVYGEISTVIVDEANYCSQDLLFEIESNYHDVLLTATPYRRPTIVEIWADHSPYWRMERVPASDAPFIEDHRLRDFDATISDEQATREIDAETPYHDT